MTTVTGLLIPTTGPPAFVHDQHPADGVRLDWLHAVLGTDDAEHVSGGPRYSVWVPGSGVLDGLPLNAQATALLRSVYEAFAGRALSTPAVRLHGPALFLGPVVGGEDNGLAPDRDTAHLLLLMLAAAG